MRVIQKYLEEANADVSKVCKCIVNNKGYVLLLRRANNFKNGGTWDLPGGHQKEKESDIETVTRETKEETGLTLNKPTKVKAFKIKDDSGEVTDDIVVFKATPKGPGRSIDMKTSSDNSDPHFWHNLPRPEHSEYKWIKFQDELERMPMQDELKEVVIKQLESRTNP